MRVARIFTNLTCNENCGFCDRRRSSEDPAFVAHRAVLARIEESVGSDTREAILTGGEPTLRRDLPLLIHAAAQRGAQRVTLETNGTLITPALATKLRRAGLSRARVHLPAWREALDAITRTPGGFAQTLSGMRALAHEGIELVAVAPVLAQNLASLPHLPEQLASADLPVAGLEVFVPTAAPDVEALAPLAAAAEAIEATWKTAKAVKIALSMGRDGLVPPCLFARPARVAHMFALTPGGTRNPAWTQLDACAECVLVESCPGLPRAALAREPELAVGPIREDRVRRRMSSAASVEEQIARELVADDIGRHDGIVDWRRIVRVNFQCNQACHFCFVSTHLPSAAEETVRGAIVEAARQGLGVVISGGEPTLNPNLVDYVRLARAEGAPSVEIQTNATRLGDGDLAQRLAEAGADRAFISFHGSRPEVCDVVTDAPGTWVHTVRGIDACVAAGIAAHLNFVFCRANVDDFPETVRFIAERWPSARVVVSFVGGMTDLVPRSRDLIPRYSEVMPRLAEGMRIAAERGLALGGFESMCGMPLCMVPDELAAHEELAEVPANEEAEEFVYAEACEECAERHRCFGIRTSYAALYGTDEFAPRGVR